VAAAVALQPVPLQPVPLQGLIITSLPVRKMALSRTMPVSLRASRSRQAFTCRW
jgi:hypothetical protein